MSEEKHDLSYWLENIPRIILVIVIILAMAIPQFYSFGLPIVASQPTIDYYTTLTALKPGSVVLIGFEYELAAAATINPGVIATIKTCVQNNLRLVLFSLSSQAIINEKLILSTLNLESRGWKYGVNYVDLGFISGMESAIAGIALDIWGLVPNDAYGTPLSQLPLMSDVHGAKDISVAMEATTGTEMEWLRQFNTKYGVTCLFDVIEIIVPTLNPYYQSKQTAGYLNGGSGAAQLEFLSGFPGTAVKLTDMYSIAHLMVLTLLILGNIGYLMSARSKGRKKA
jgi:hypothetical protein